MFLSFSSNADKQIEQLCSELTTDWLTFLAGRNNLCRRLNVLSDKDRNLLQHDIMPNVTHGFAGLGLRCRSYERDENDRSLRD